MENFLDVIRIETENYPSRLKKFILPRQISSSEQNWSYFAYAFSKAFEELTMRAMDVAPRMDYLRLPLFVLGRHSIVLALKEAIKECARCTSDQPEAQGHSLQRLWNELLNELTRAGYFPDDPWTTYCGKLITHLHEVDPKGESFRYPCGRDGSTFVCMEIDIEQLARAQQNIVLYCDAVISMVSYAGDV